MNGEMLQIFKENKMKMTIDEVIKYLPAPICGSTVINSEKQKEYDARFIAVDILHKYQKIERIIDAAEFSGEFKKSKSESYWLNLVKEVIEDKTDSQM